MLPTFLDIGAPEEIMKDLFHQTPLVASNVSHAQTTSAPPFFPSTPPNLKPLSMSDERSYSRRERCPKLLIPTLDSPVAKDESSANYARMPNQFGDSFFPQEDDPLPLMFQQEEDDPAEDDDAPLDHNCMVSASSFSRNKQQHQPRKKKFVLQPRRRTSDLSLLDLGDCCELQIKRARPPASFVSLAREEVKQEEHFSVVAARNLSDLAAKNEEHKKAQPASIGGVEDCSSALVGTTSNRSSSFTSVSTRGDAKSKDIYHGEAQSGTRGTIAAPLVVRPATMRRVTAVSVTHDSGHQKSLDTRILFEPSRSSAFSFGGEGSHPHSLLKTTS